MSEQERNEGAGAAVWLMFGAWLPFMAAAGWVVGCVVGWLA
jgi:hypothetical protein